ncbi:MAG: HAD-IIA family hydrolase [Thermotogaceae bacterium]|nr:HAD-IIA family hydrolase [Thermotogaceae bacterium]
MEFLQKQGIHSCKKHELLVNKEYSSTNNMYSLGMAFDNVWNEDWNTVYVLNGDVVFEKSFLKNASGESSGVFVDKTMYIEESMKVILGEDGYISDISKKIGEDSYYAVSVDMYRFQREEAEIFYKRIKEILSSGRVNQWTEVALSELFREGLLKMVPIDISGYIWWEIDNHEDKLRTLFRLNLLHDLPDLINCKLFVFDLDGTINLGNRPIDRAPDFIELLRKFGKYTAFLTNNSSMTNQDHKEIIERILGIDVEEREVFSSLDHLKDYLDSKKYEKIFYVLNDRALHQLGVSQNQQLEADAVVVGFDTEITYEKMRKAVILLQKGADLIVVYPDMRCPTDEGFIPNAGSISQLIGSVSGEKVFYVGGKPYPQMIVDIASRFGVELSEIVYFVDRIYTDIKMVEKLPAKAFLMLTGETNFEDLLDDTDLIGGLETNNVFLVENFRFLYRVFERIIVLF